MQTKEHHGGFSWRICLSFVCFLFCLFVFFFFLRPPKFVIADLEIGGGVVSFYLSLQRKRFLSPSHVPSLDFCAVMKNFSLLIACLVTFLRVIDLRFCCFEFGVNLAPVIVLIAWIGLVLFGTRLQAAPISLGFSNEMPPQFENFMRHVERKIIIKGTACNQVLNFIHAWCLVRYRLFSRQKVTRFCYFNQVGFHRYIYFCKFFI